MMFSIIIKISFTILILGGLVGIAAGLWEPWSDDWLWIVGASSVPIILCGIYLILLAVWTA